MIAMWLFLGCFGGAKVTSHELDALCAVATEVQGDASVGQKQRMKEIGRRAASRQLGPAGTALLSAIAKAPPSARAALITHAAKEAGVPNWQCPALTDAGAP